MDKKSQGNIELVLSFVIFAGFVLVMLVFLNPLRNSATSYASLDTIQTKIMDNITLEFDSLSLKVSQRQSQHNKDCFSINLTGAGSLGKIIALSSNNSGINANKNNAEIIFEKTSDDFYVFYFSDSFNEVENDWNNCKELDEEEYLLGLLRSEKRVLFENLENLYESYVKDYSKLRTGLAIRANFDFSVFNSTGIIFDTSDLRKIKAGSVISRDIPLRAITKNAGDIEIVLRLRTW